MRISNPTTDMKSILTTTLFFVIALSQPCSAQMNFMFRYYQTYQGKKGAAFDTTILWNGAALQKTFENKGTIIYYPAKTKVRIKLRDNDFEETHYVFHTSKNYFLLINGMKIFQFNDPELGPSVAIYQYPKNNWIIYRQNPIQPKAAIASRKTR